MKKYFLLALLMLLPLGMMADGNYVTIELTEAGTLQDRLIDSGYDSVDGLTVKGKFNSLDLKYLREATGRLANLVYLDLSDIELVDSEEEYYSWTEFYGAIGTRYPCHHYILSPTEYTESKYVGRSPNGQTHYYHHTPNFDYAICVDSRQGSVYGENNRVLKEVRLPKSNSSVGEYAFNGCRALEKVVLPVNCETVGARAFSSNENLATLVNSNNINSVGDYAFCNTAINAAFAPLRVVGTSAFEGTSIESISFVDGFEIFPKNAFYNCMNLKEIKIPGSVETIGESAFSGCTGLTKVVVGDGTRVLGDYCFSGCTNATDFTLPSTITIVGKEALNGVPLGSDYEDGVQYVGSIAYKYDGTVGDLVIREGTTCVASYFAFESFNKITSLSLPSTLKGIGDWGFASWVNQCDAPQLILPEGLEDIGKGAFAYWKKISTLTIPSSVKHLGDGPFAGCSALVRVNWNAEDADNCAPFFYSSWADGSSIEIVNIGEGVKRIPADCFDGHENLIKVTISSTVEEIGDDTPYVSGAVNLTGGFSNCPKLKTVTFAENSKLKKIGKGAFSGSTALKEITIPASVELIAENAFEGDYNKGSALEKVTFAKGSKLKEIRSQAFAHCTSLTSIELPEGLITLGGEDTDYGTDYGVFSDCTSLTTVKLPKSLTTIGKIDASWITGGTFCGCTSLTSIELPENLQKLGAYTFYQCKELKSIELPASINEIGNSAFQECSKLSTVVSYIKNPFETAAFVEYGTLFVPSGTKALYEALDGWKSFTIKETIAGDLNGDEVVNVDDVEPAVNIIMTGSFDGFNKAAADMNGNSKVNATDIVLLINSINGQELGETGYYLVGDHNGWDTTDKTYAFTKLNDGKTWEITIPSEGAGCFKIAPESAYTHQDGSFWSYLLCAESDQYTGLTGVMRQGDYLAAWLLDVAGATSYTIRIVPSEMTFQIIAN